MAKDTFTRYIWLVDTIYRADGITFEEINEKWLRSSMSDGQDIPLKTFHNHRNAIEEIFDISIVCDRRNGYRYYVENADDMKKGGVRTWLLNTFAVNNLINESHRLKRRILFERIPSGQKHLTTIIEAMRDGHTLEMTYRSFWRQDSYTAEVEPYFVKIFRQRWYMVARNTAKDALRIYALDRVQEMRETDNSFTYPKDFDPEEYFCDCFGIIHDDNCPPEIVELKVFGTQREYFRTLPPSRRLAPHRKSVYSTAIARAMSKRFQGVSFLGGSHKKRIRSLVTGCVKLREYAQRASLPFCARSPP